MNGNTECDAFVSLLVRLQGYNLRQPTERRSYPIVFCSDIRVPINQLSLSQLASNAYLVCLSTEDFDCVDSFSYCLNIVQVVIVANRECAIIALNLGQDENMLALTHDESGVFDKQIRRR